MGIKERDIEYIKSRMKLPWVEYVKIYTRLNGKKILDAGCGWGWLYDVIVKEGAFYFGIDPDEKKIKTAMNLWKQGDFKTGKAENIPFENIFFDLIITIDTVEHMQNIKKSFKEFYRVLKPDGYLFIFAPNFFNINNYDSSIKEKFKYCFNFLKGKKSYIERPGVISFLLIRLLKKAGFKKADFLPPLKRKNIFQIKILKFLLEFIRPTIKIYAKK